ncbi:MAG: tetratricopeptide repeat protein [Candidatus Thermoplasmatota archaeon]
MRQSNGLSPTQEKIVSHLAPLSHLSESYLQPSLVTQDGIARSVGMARNHVPRAINTLISKGLVEARKARVEGAERKKTCYFLTPAGFEIASDLRRMEAPSPPKVSFPAAPHFTGRGMELNKLRRWLTDGPPMLVICGGRGMGKTALASHFASCQEGKRSVYYWSLTYHGSLSKGIEALGEAMAQPVGRLLSYLARAEQGGAVSKLARHLDEVEPPLLLVLDDAEEEDLRELAKALGTSERTRVLVLTAKEWGDASLSLGPLDEKDSKRLAEKLGHPNPGGAFSLSGGKPFLITAWRRDLEWVECQMSEEELNVLRLLSAFSRPVHIGEAASLGIDYRTISILAGKEALALENEHIHLLTRPKPQDGKRRRASHARIARTLLLLWSDASHAIEACRHFMEAGEEAGCAGVLCEKGEEMVKAGLAKEVEEVIRALHVKKLKIGVQANLLVLMGGIAKLNGKWREAISFYRTAIALRKQDKGFVAENTARIASVHLSARELEKARAVYDRAEKLLPPDTPAVAARINDELATLYLRMGDMGQAAEHSARAIAMARESGDEELVALCEATAGNVAMLQRRLGDAERHFKSALSVLRRRGNVRVEGTILNNLAAVMLKQHKVDEGIELLRESASLFEKHGDRRYCMALANLATVLWRRGVWAEARDACERALAAAEAMGDAEIRAACLSVKARDAEYQGGHEEAIASLRSVIRIREGLPDRGALARGRAELAGALISSDRPREGYELLPHDIEWAERAGQSEDAALVLHQAARALLAMGDMEQAGEYMKKALSSIPEHDLRGRARLFRTIGILAGLRGDWYVAVRYLEDSVKALESLKEVPGLCISKYDLAMVMKHCSLNGAADALAEARTLLDGLGIPFPPPTSDWHLAHPEGDMNAV